MSADLLIEPGRLADHPEAVVVDCRFSLADPEEAKKNIRQKQNHHNTV